MKAKQNGSGMKKEKRVCVLRGGCHTAKASFYLNFWKKKQNRTDCNAKVAKEPMVILLVYLYVMQILNPVFPAAFKLVLLQSLKQTLLFPLQEYSESY